MNWLLLLIAGLFEVGFATCLGKARATNGNTSIYWMIGFFVSLSISMLLLYKATQTLPIGTAYAIWSGIGAAGTDRQPATWHQSWSGATTARCAFYLA